MVTPPLIGIFYNCCVNFNPTIGSMTIPLPGTSGGFEPSTYKSRCESSLYKTNSSPLNIGHPQIGKAQVSPFHQLSGSFAVSFRKGNPRKLHRWQVGALSSKPQARDTNPNFTWSYGSHVFQMRFTKQNQTQIFWVILIEASDYEPVFFFRS